MKKIIVVLVLLITTILSGCMGIPVIEGGINYRVGVGAGHVYTNGQQHGQKIPQMHQGGARRGGEHGGGISGGRGNGTYYRAQ